MGTARTRAHKIGWSSNYFERNFKEDPRRVIDKEAFIADFCVVHNSTPRTAEEILQLLEKTFKIKMKGEEITNGDRF